MDKYEKLYNEALERAKEYTEHSTSTAPETSAINNALYSVFPELRESDDERIRKFICSIIDNLEPKDFVGVKKMNVLAWLEKHEECVADSSKTSTDEDGNIRKGLEILVQNAVYPGLITERESKNYLAYLEKQKEATCFAELMNKLTATEQEVMFNAWPKEEKEQKPSAEEILAKAGLKPFKDGNQWCVLVGDNIQEGICGFGDTIDDALYQFLMEVLEKQKEQKPAEWGEEDEDALNHLHEFISWGYAEKFMDAQTAHDMRAWINEHLCPQPKPEWNEEDERMLVSFLHKVEVCDLLTNREYAWIVKRLKSLRPRWKPSEEQMKALYTMICECRPADQQLLQDIYYGLKKLM